MITAVAEVATNRPARLEHMIIEGYTRKFDFSTVRTLIDHLEAAHFVASADLLSDDKLVQADPSESKGTDRKLKRFVIDVKVGER